MDVPISGTIYIFVVLTRIIVVHTVKNYWVKYPECEQALKSWIQEVERSNWQTPNSLKEHYKNASIITRKRVVFNIKGNSYRLVVDIEFRLQIVFIVWFGNHKEYDVIDVKTIRYDKADKVKK